MIQFQTDDYVPTSGYLHQEAKAREGKPSGDTNNPAYKRHNPNIEMISWCSPRQGVILGQLIGG